MCTRAIQAQCLNLSGAVSPERHRHHPTPVFQWAPLLGHVTVEFTVMSARALHVAMESPVESVPVEVSGRGNVETRSCRYASRG